MATALSPAKDGKRAKSTSLPSEGARGIKARGFRFISGRGLLSFLQGDGKLGECGISSRHQDF
jgi:hypothetical protein